jgi:hypothetical protein
MNFFPYICHRRKVPDDLLIALNPEEDSTLQAQFPAVPIVFCETRPLAEEWTYRWLGALPV